MEKHRIIISGVGRSGTSFLFEEFAAALKSIGPSHFFYEPYLWHPDKVNMEGQVSREPFDTRNLWPFGIFVHCESPLFLQGAHPVHDQMVNRIFGRDCHVMAKMIRGNGRLRSYLEKYPNLKVVGIIRDVVGTVNSVLNHFSFFGEEFHPTDRPRFRNEVQQKFGKHISIPAGSEALKQAVWSAVWWQYMTKALLDVHRDYPDRVCLVDYGSLTKNPDAAYRFMEDFSGIPLSRHRLKKRVGIVSSANYLGDAVPEILTSYHTWLQQEFKVIERNAFLEGDSPSLSSISSVTEGFMESSAGVVPKFPLFRTAIGWRYALNDQVSRHDTLKELYASSLRTYSEAAVQKATEPKAPSVCRELRPGVSVIIPVWNAAETIERSMATVWDQAGVDVEVVIVNDASTDETAEVVERLLRNNPGRMVQNERNLGPGMSRHKGIMAASYDLISTLDSDDIMLPLKLQAETDAMAGDPEIVAFSDVIYQRGDQFNRWTFETVSGLEKRDLLPKIAGRLTRIPRDMTFSRQLYNRTRGFETMLRMYEDWSLKIELAGAASRWLSTGELGVLYEHKQSGLSAGDEGKHRFFLHAAYLKHADALAAQMGVRSVGLLRNAVSQFGIPNDIEQGLSRLQKRAEFSGNLISDFSVMRQQVHRQVFRDDIPYSERLVAAYGAISEASARQAQRAGE